MRTVEGKEEETHFQVAAVDRRRNRRKKKKTARQEETDGDREWDPGKASRSARCRLVFAGSARCRVRKTWGTDQANRLRD